MNNVVDKDAVKDSHSEQVPVLKLKEIYKSFTQGKVKLDVLTSVDFAISAGETVALIGPSGAGKSTLLNIAGLLEGPDGGEVLLNGNSCKDLPDDARTGFRREYLGFVYQNHNLLPEFSALENVLIPQLIAGEKSKLAKERSIWLLEKLGLKERLKHRPAELSGGEQQRVAIARALANRPKLLLADEPTGNLDPNTAAIVFAELLGLVKETGLSAFIATHNPELAAQMTRQVTLEEGRLVELTKTEDNIR